MPGKGSPGLRGGPTGDLFVTVRVTPHPYFDRRGDDIHGVVPVTVKEAYAGAEIEVALVPKRASEALLETASARDARMIVVGTSGEGALKGMILGSTGGWMRRRRSWQVIRRSHQIGAV